MKTFLQLLKKEFMLEWRLKIAFNSILLYTGSAVFICYMSFGVRAGALSPFTWNALFWIIVLFIAINAMAKSFLQERQGRQLYYYSIASPFQIILSKILYNFLLMSVFTMAAFGFYAILLGDPVQDKGYFFLAILLGSIGFSASLTLISAIASKAGAGSSLMAVLSFPVLIPMILMLVKLSKNAVDGLARSVSTDEIQILLGVNLLLGTVSYLLFPYLWKS
jgi:heme exporter protein B